MPNSIRWQKLQNIFMRVGCYLLPRVYSPLGSLYPEFGPEKLSSVLPVEAPGLSTQPVLPTITNLDANQGRTATHLVRCQHQPSSFCSFFGTIDQEVFAAFPDSSAAKCHTNGTSPASASKEKLNMILMSLLCINSSRSHSWSNPSCPDSKAEIKDLRHRQA